MIMYEFHAVSCNANLKDRIISNPSIAPDSDYELLVGINLSIGA